MNLRPLLTRALLGILICTSAFLPTAAQADSDAPTEITGALVKIFTVANPYDWYNPWQRAGTQQYTGSGVVLTDGRILTNAHVVDSAVSIEVKPHGGSKRFSAKLLHVSSTCDLALLSVNDESFRSKTKSLPLGDMPAVQDAVTVLGYPVGGENLSVTTGVVSRVEFSSYTNSLEDLLTVQIDAAINNGNSGGPVVSDGKIVGIATQALEEAENVGYMVPPPVIAHFLEDAADGSIDGFPKLGTQVQDLQSKAHRRKLQLKDGNDGVLVTAIDHGASAWGHVQAGDVLMAIDGIPIASDLTVDSPYGARLDFGYLPRLKQVGETTELTVLRNGQSTEISFALTCTPSLVPALNSSDRPRYRVFGGVIFMPLDMDYCLLFEEIPTDLLYHTLYRNERTAERSEVVLLSRVLPHEVTRGYHDREDYIVASVQGKKPRDFAHFNEILDGIDGQWLEVVTESGERVVLDVAEARAAHEGILEGFGIGRDRWLSESNHSDGATAR